MTVPRDNPYMYATWPTRYIIGDKSCLWACWYKTHYYKYPKAPSDFDLVRWQAEHTVLMDSLTNEIEQKGCTVWIEHQNSFRIESPRSGLTVSGRPDLIARHPDGTVVIYDAKTGQAVHLPHPAGADLHVHAAQNPRLTVARHALFGLRLLRATAPRSASRRRASTKHSSNGSWTS